MPAGGTSRLPVAIKSVLDRRFPGWKFIEVGDDIRHFIREQVSADARPDLVTGDFDGNGQLDWWVLSARKEETRVRWLEKLIEDSAAGRRMAQFARKKGA